jgi:hypothetical protein
MADRPILFSAPMVRALLDGRKTQTRRILKPQPTINSAGLLVWDHGADFIQGTSDDIAAGQRTKAGDRLWVREAWRCNGWATDVATVFYRASEGDGYTAMCEQYPVANKKQMRITSTWRPSIHMPRWASRLTLTVTEVRVERLQDISRGDAIAEGLVTVPHAPGLAAEMDCNWGFDGDARHGSPISAYAALWESINGPGAWQENPCVVAYTFTVERKNIDEVANA